MINIRNISLFGGLFAIVVIALGAWTRLVDAGLGCPDWPGCYVMDLLLFQQLMQK